MSSNLGADDRFVVGRDGQVMTRFEPPAPPAPPADFRTDLGRYR
jgi:glutathione peroxidase-family protein